MIAQLSKAYIQSKPTKAISRLISYFFFEGRPLSTKGQYINPFLLFFYKIIQFFPPLKKINKPIYIIGMGRSGTTVLGRILSLHSDLGFLNEPKAMWYFSNNKDDIIGSYTDAHGNYCMNSMDATKSVKNKIRKLYAFYLRTIFTKRVLDKYPEMIFRTEYIKEIYPDAKFIFIYRNGLDAATSSTEWSEKNADVISNIETHDWWGKNNRKWELLINDVAKNDQRLNSEKDALLKLNNHLDKSTIEWILTMNKGYELMQTNDPSIMPVKYEDLTNQPERVLSDIFSFCELENEKKVIDFAKKILIPNKSKELFNIPKPFDSHFNYLMQKFGYN